VFAQVRAILKTLFRVSGLCSGTSPGALASRAEESPFLRFAPAGHFYSPLPDLAEVAARSAVLFRPEIPTCPGINLREHAQLALLEQLSAFYAELPFPQTPDHTTRYYYENDFFSYGDAIVLYAMLRYQRPQRVIEIGSGFSSAVMLDVNDRFFDASIQFTFIDPYPARLLQLLRRNDRQTQTILPQPIQEVSLDSFHSLAAGDIVFIDSSHVVKIGSDVAHLLYHVLPALPAGVIIHFHDILWPFEYPQAWVYEGRAWNEAYVLRAFLQYNDTFEIVYFNSYMGYHHADIVHEKMPLCSKNPGGSLWLRKVR
jgi:hypothetical protein